MENNGEGSYTEAGRGAHSWAEDGLRLLSRSVLDPVRLAPPGGLDGVVTCLSCREETCDSVLSGEAEVLISGTSVMLFPSVEEKK
ncbi:hypothetical protein GN956_G13881 [Arapaima gigas]